MDDRIKFLSATRQAKNKKKLEDVVEELKNEIIILKQQIKDIQVLLNGNSNESNTI